MRAAQELHCGGIFAAARDQSRVSGLTHSFYKYPARFSPQFVRAAIEQFTDHGDLVVDPFMGGGTSAVEALACGRSFVGTDCSSLAHFVSSVKTTILPPSEIREVVSWLGGFERRATTREPVERPTEWIEAGYQRNLDGQDLWRIRKTIEIAANEAAGFSRARQRRFARAVILKSAQAALDTRKDFPSVLSFRRSLGRNAKSMGEALVELAQNVSAHRHAEGQAITLKKGSAESVGDLVRLNGKRARLIVTSPPYPGVHVLYHRWQVRGGRETPLLRCSCPALRPCRVSTRP